MRLPRPFFQLPVLFDAARLRAEVATLPQNAWVAHPNDIPGNSAVRLISVDAAESDGVCGDMLPTCWLQSMPYVQQVLASFGVVWSRSRLMRLAPGASVPEHADINYHWHSRVRLHIPVITRPEVKFYCGDEVVHMEEGHAWIFDNWRLHRVDNPTSDERIHLVADTSGTSTFWQFVAQGSAPTSQWRRHHYRPDLQVVPLTESNPQVPVMPPSEVQLLFAALGAELIGVSDSSESRQRVRQLQSLLEGFVCDWRQTCALRGVTGHHREEFERLIVALRHAAQPLAQHVVARTNRVEAMRVLEARVLRHLLAEPAASAIDRALQRPVFIVAAPRSGSTLLFETLACSPDLSTLGGEAHWLIENHESLRPGAPGVDSNRLTAQHCTDEIAAAIRRDVRRSLQSPDGSTARSDARLLEKTPKNSLRIPFLDRIFPDAQFIFLWRDPRDNISSIMEAWRAGRWITYPSLPDWDGPWSLLLPPDWRNLRGLALEEIAAEQWKRANETIINDLATLPRNRWIALSYGDFITNPARATQRLCEFMEIPFDAALRTRTSASLPLSRFTLSAPAPEKWKSDEAAISAVLPQVEACWHELRSMP